MSYVTTGSSNSVTNGSPLELEIVISEASLKKILIMGVFTIENLNNIASREDLKNMTCILYGKTDDTGMNVTTPVKIREFNYDSSATSKRSQIFSRSYSDEFTYLILKIRDAKCTIQPLTTELKIIFKDKNDTTRPRPTIEIPFTVQNVQSKPEILSFNASPLVLQGNNKPVTLDWKVKGESYTYILREGLHELYRKNGRDTENDSFKIDPVPIGDHLYTLEVQQGNVSITKTLQVRALDNSELSAKANPLNPYLIGNICVSQNSNYLFSLILKTENKIGKIDHIGYTNEGFSGEWGTFNLLDEDKEKIKPFATSPMVHLRDVNEVYGRLFFIGGSYVKTKECSNAVAIVDLDEEDENSRIRIIENLPWASRMGHTCEVFPHGDATDKIWLLGGVDEWGGALNDIWVSGDGENWENINENNAQQTQMPWEARCFTGTSIELDNKGGKKELWIGGGFSEIGGRETADIWRWNKSNWTKIEPLVVNNNTYLSSGMCFLGKDTVQSTGVYLFGGYVDGTTKKKHFEKINKEGNVYSSTKLDTSSGADTFATSKNAYIITIYFKGCLWYMVLTNEGDLGITYSKLFYWVPVVTERTLILT